MNATAPTRKLTLDDIADLRAYEREREDFRSHVIALKKRRRVHVGPFVTVLFENRDTIRFQIQEMARAEKLLSDEAIQTELEIYNPLIPEPGHLACTMFIELTSDAELREWLPKLVGIERSVQLRLADGSIVTATPEAAHDEQLTRDEITASVHYLELELGPEQIDELAERGARVAVAHDEYDHEIALSDDTVAELLTDLRS